MTFLISHDGVVYQKDLGPATAQLAPKMTRFDPGPGWQKVALTPAPRCRKRPDPVSRKPSGWRTCLRCAR